MVDPGKKHRRDAGTATAVGELLLDALAHAGLNEQVLRLKINRIWPTAVGQDIARRCQPHTFQRGTLVVKSTSAAWQNELTFLKDTIIRQLNRHLEAPLIKDLRVISGSAQPDPAASALSAAARKRPEPPLSAEEMQATRNAAAQITDTEIRDAFAEMMAQALRSQHARR